MKRWQAERIAAALVLGVALSTVACENDASGLTEWTPADHDHQAEPRQRRTMANMAQKASPHSAPSQKNQVIDVTWGKQCATCHGRRGKGDGPSSTMVKARDLTNPEFQASVSDEQLAKVIREGKDKMPAFNLPDSIVQGLVQHVRGFAKRDRGRGRDNDDSDLTEPPGAEEAAAAPGAAPPGAAPPGAVAAPGAAAPGAAPNAPASASAAPPGGAAHGADTSGQPPTLTPAPAKAPPPAAPAKVAPPAAPAKAPASPAPAGSTPPAPPANHP